MTYDETESCDSIKGQDGDAEWICKERFILGCNGVKSLNVKGKLKSTQIKY